MYADDTSLAPMTPVTGKRKIGRRDVTAIGIASVIQKTAVTINTYAHPDFCLI